MKPPTATNSRHPYIDGMRNCVASSTIRCRPLVNIASLPTSRAPGSSRWDRSKYGVDLAPIPCFNQFLRQLWQALVALGLPIFNDDRSAFYITQVAETLAESVDVGHRCDRQYVGGREKP